MTSRYFLHVEPIRAVRWAGDGEAVRIIDQRRLPSEYVERDLRSLEDVREAILTLAVRGAPAIGVAASMGLVTSLLDFAHEDAVALRARLRRHVNVLSGVRPTAVNLANALHRMAARAETLPTAPVAALLLALRAEATAILEEDRAMCAAIGRHGLVLVPDGARVLTHCNAGALATAGIGTALAPVYAAHEAGRRVRVFACETRPLLQGARLTAWELARAGIQVTLLTDGMAASIMRSGEVDLVIVGADRVAANGDVANKVGTYALALAARHHAIPFYVAAPRSTIDPATPTGDTIIIEHRDADEVRVCGGTRIAPADADVLNPAFDVTPGTLITGILTDTGICRAPYSFAFARGD